jgi:chromosome segregation ATPase
VAASSSSPLPRLSHNRLEARGKDKEEDLFQTAKRKEQQQLALLERELTELKAKANRLQDERVNVEQLRVQQQSQHQAATVRIQQRAAEMHKLKNDLELLDEEMKQETERFNLTKKEREVQERKLQRERKDNQKALAGMKIQSFQQPVLALPKNEVFDFNQATIEHAFSLLRGNDCKQFASL